MKIHLLKFENEDAAKHDAVVGGNFYQNNNWNKDHITPNVSVTEDGKKHDKYWMLLKSDLPNTSFQRHEGAKLVWDDSNGGLIVSNMDVNKTKVSPLPEGRHPFDQSKPEDIAKAQKEAEAKANASSAQHQNANPQPNLSNQAHTKNFTVGSLNQNQNEKAKS